MSDEAAFADFYQATYPGLVAELYAYTGDLTEAQDAAQDAFIRAWTHWGRISRYDQPRAWLARVAYRIAVSRWRRIRRGLTARLRERPPPAAPPPDAESLALLTALARIPENQRRALVLHHMAGYRVAEIAEICQVAEGTVKAWLSRGRQRLAGLLTEQDEPSTSSGASHA